MQATQAHGIDWWVGSNGNLFGDYNGFRYCIRKRQEGGYIVARNGYEIAAVPSVAEAKLYVKREG